MKTKEEELFAAIELNNISKIIELIEQGVNIKTINENGSSPLHWSSYCGYAEITKLLIKNGANLGGINKWDETPLKIANRLRHGEIVKVLLENGATI